MSHKQKSESLLRQHKLRAPWVATLLPMGVLLAHMRQVAVALERKAREAIGLDH